MTGACPLCRSADVVDGLALDDVPVLCNLLWPTREAALAAPRAAVRLAHCPACGHLFNRAYDPSLVVYDSRYENALDFSPRFAVFADDLATRLIEAHDLRGRHVVEVGGGDGAFLARLCRLGGNRGTLFDPAARAPDDAPFEVVRAAFGPAPVDADLVVCRHVLEHVADPTAFLAGLRGAMGGRGALYLEVPNALAMLRRPAPWDAIYEHPSHFTPASLARAVAAAGFRVGALDELYEGQFLGLEAIPGAATEPPADHAASPDAVAGFTTAAAAEPERWRDRLAELAAPRAVWGVGSKGVMFLNLAGRDAVALAVDVNPRKHGRFVPGTGHPVEPPEALATARPGTVIVMNPIYRAEIEGRLGELGLTPAVHVV